MSSLWELVKDCFVNAESLGDATVSLVIRATLSLSRYPSLSDVRACDCRQQCRVDHHRSPHGAVHIRELVGAANASRREGVREGGRMDRWIDISMLM